jgi:hypothetical protein
MLDKLFGPHRSWQRNACIALSALVVLLGLAVIPEQGAASGVAVALLGVLCGAVLARMADNRVAVKASREMLGSITEEMDTDALRSMVDSARTSSPARLPEIDGKVVVDDDLPWSEEQPSRR